MVNLSVHRQQKQTNKARMIEKYAVKQRKHKKKIQAKCRGLLNGATKRKD